jgi:C-terminal processing protease CtpA/Prc
MKESQLNFDTQKFLEILKKYSYYTNEVDWHNFEAELNKIKEINLAEINRLLKIVDGHSFAEVNTEKFKIMGSVPNVETKEHGNDIGYLKLPGFYTQSEHGYKKNYEDIIISLSKLSAKRKLILDLSENTGGNMYPWIAALAPLYDKRTVGYFEYKYKKEKDGWNLKEDGIFCGEKKWFGEVNKNQLNFEKIAVIVSGKTASSGEAIAMSFVGQDNIKLFGQETANFTTGNEDFQIGDYKIWLSTCVMQDRNNRSYLDGVVPDVETDKPVEEINLWFCKA